MTRVAIASLIGRHVTARRMAKGLTQQDVADKAGVSRQLISFIELGTACPSLTTLYVVADALGVEAFDLIPARRQVRAFRPNGSG